MSERTENFITYLLTAVIIALLVGILFLVYQEDKECRARGGVLVRTAFGAECLRVTPA